MKKSPCHALSIQFKKHGNRRVAKEQSAYMRNLFPFFGIKTPERQALVRGFLKSQDFSPSELRSFCLSCWTYQEREMHYAGLEALAVAIKKEAHPSDLKICEKLALKHSWWDSIDTIAPLVGELLKKFPNERKMLTKWLVSGNFWLQRITLIHQLRYKTSTDTTWLSKSIRKLQADPEFFIQKAIGWSLREYSKTNPSWVRNFLKKYPQGSLATREASKYL